MVQVAKNTFFCLLLMASFVSCNTDKDAPFIIVFTGDVLLDRGVGNVIDKIGVENLFSDVHDFFVNADDVVINLECPLTNKESPVNKQYVFRADTGYASSLHNAGITIANMANNHSVDQGPEGLKNTAESLHNAGIKTIGYGETISKPLELSKNGIDVALFSSCILPIENWIYGNEISQKGISELCESVRIYRDQHPFTRIITILHWGVEMQTKPTQQQQMDAIRLINSGVDVIIGHHPHVIQPMKEINGHPVFFSLGNFVFDQHSLESKKAQIVCLKLYKDSIANIVQNVEIVSCCPRLIE